MATIDVFNLIVGVIVLFVGAGVMKGLAKGMTPLGKEKGYGTAFFLMIIWYLIYFLLQFFGVEEILTVAVGGLIATIIILIGYWILFSLLIRGFYGGSFGKAMGIAILFALILLLLLFVIGFLLLPLAAVLPPTITI